MSDIMAVTYEDVQSVSPVASGNIWSQPMSGFFVNVAGNIQIITARNTTVTMTVLAGLIYPIAIKSVLSGSTTATGIFAVLASPQKGWT